MNTPELSHFNTEVDEAGIAWITFDQHASPVNTLSTAVLAELEILTGWMEQSTLVGAVLRSGKAGGFIAGADVREFETFTDPAQLSAGLKQVHALFERLERLAFPLIAAIHGYCLGGGLELALACHGRIAVDDARTKLGFPEVKLGLFPGFGGTGRSVALSGGVAAMTAMLSGKSYGARQARGLGWVDRCVATPDRLAWTARKMISRGLPRRTPRLTHRLMALPGVRHLLAEQMRKKTAAKVNLTHYPAPFALIDLYRQHGANPQRMRAAETTEFPPLMVSRTSQSLRRLFFASEALKANAEPFDGLKRVHVIGAGVMGGDIAAWCALSGFEVTLQDLDAGAVDRAVERAQKLFAKRARRQPARDNARARLIADPEGNGIANADLIIEAVVEREDVKQALFRDLEARAKSSAVLATNTSSIALARISRVMDDPSRLVGVHFFNPVAQLPLVEVIHDDATDAAVVECARGFVVAIRKYPLVVKSGPGFLVNRVLGPYMLDALRRVDEGESIDVIDAAAVAFGMPMGPVELADTVGLDICLAVATELGIEAPADGRLRQHVAAGNLGCKTGQGYLSWTQGKLARTLPNGDAELGGALLKPLVDECERCLSEGVVASADEIDIGVIMGTGFAPFLGGPLNARHLEII